MKVEYLGNIYEVVDIENGIVYLQSVSSDAHKEVNYTTFLHCGEYRPV